MGTISLNVNAIGFFGRKNPPLELLNKMATKAVDGFGGESEGELILSLEGDPREKHFRTVFDLLDSNFSFIRMYQLIMLPGTCSASVEHQIKYGFKGQFRVLPGCFGIYRFGDDHFACAEIEEIIITPKSMPHSDYQACRDLHLIVEIFANDSIFFDLTKYLSRWDVSRPESSTPRASRTVRINKRFTATAWTAVWKPKDSSVARNLPSGATTPLENLPLL